MSRPRFSSNTVRVVGSLIPPDVLAKAMAREGLEGLEPQDFGLGEDVRLRDAINDAWNEAKALWWRFRAELRELPDDDPTATALTRERWLLPLLELLGFDDIEVVSEAIEVGGTRYPISHLRRATPLHLMGARVDLDGRVAGIRGAARLSPHSLLQQFLNRSDDHLWGIVSNGFRLRILRDSVSLTRQAFVEFDLEAMFNGEVFPDFILLYLVGHASRFDAPRPEECLLERWIAAARDEGIRALDQLRSGVETALNTLGTGFLSHPNSGALRDAVESSRLDARRLYRYLLRLVYRLLFLFVAEDRDLLHAPGTSAEARDRYRRFYSTSRLRDLATRPASPGHSDLWEGLVALMEVLGRDEGEPRLGLPGLGSFLWAPDAIGPLTEADIDNEALLEAIQHLAHVEEDGTSRRIDFANLGSEELGSVYESLLELHPSINDREFVLGAGAGSERKTTGSYYTPTELISELLDSALDPVLAEAAGADDPEHAILDLKVVDPAVGSGHFLVAAAHRIAKKLAEVRTGEPEPPEDAYRTALRDVVSRCLYAVDLNDLAVELCKVSLWLEALEPGKPLSFLDHHILVGNSLFGATPASIASGIPDDAFAVLTGDDKKTVSELKKRNRRERAGQDELAFGAAEMITLGSEIEALEAFDDSDLETVRTKERMLADWKASEAYEHARLVADAWCAAFAIEKRPGVPPLTEAAFRRLRDDGVVDPALRDEIERLRDRFGFFHWHLAFPQVFHPGEVDDPPGWTGGFDVVLGNPPWERVKLQEKEFFAQVAPDVAAAPNAAARRRLINRLPTENPGLWDAFQQALRDADAVSHFLRRSGIYPLCGRGDVNTYTVFAELMRTVVAPTGRVGVIVPTGIATDDTTKYFFADLVDRRSLVSLFDFENRKKIFPGIDSRIKFCLLTLAGPGRPVEEAEFVFFALGTADLRDPEKRFTLSPEDFALLNPNTRTCPIFRTRRDAEITKGIYRRVPVLVDETREDGNPWGIEFSTMFHMSNDSHLFRTREQLEADGWTLRGNVFEKEGDRYLPLYEAKMIHQFDHRFATYEPDGTIRNVTEAEHEDPSFVVMPRYWVPEDEVRARMLDPDAEFLVGFRDICRATDIRTVISTILPPVGVGHNAPLIHPTEQSLSPTLASVLNSFVLDYVARQKLGGTHLTFFILRQLPVLPPTCSSSGVQWESGSSLGNWLDPRLQELLSTAPDLNFGRRLGWSQVRRQLIEVELDAAFFHLYGIGREDVDYIMETFPIVKKHDIAKHGSYRTKELILDVYDRMAKAIETGEPYETILDPPPADPSLRVDVEPAE